MRGDRALALAATTLLVPIIAAACATGRRSEANPLLAGVLQSLLTAPRSVATFEMQLTAANVDGSTHSSYRSRGDSTVTADVVIRAIVAPEADGPSIARKQADALLAGAPGTLADSLTNPVERKDVTYQTAKGTVTGYRVRTTRVLDGVPQGLHVYALIVGQRLIAISASHPKARDAAGEIDQFAEALAGQVSEWDAVDAPARAALVPAKRFGGFDLVDTRRYPTPEAGIQYRYQDSTGLQADVYIYRGDAARFGTDTMAALRSEVGTFRESLPLAQARGYFGAYSIESDTLLTVRVGERDRALHRIRMAMTREGRPQDSYFYLAVVRGELVKVRITQPRDRFPLARADAFVQALLADVGRH